MLRVGTAKELFTIDDDVRQPVLDRGTRAMDGNWVVLDDDTVVELGTDRPLRLDGLRPWCVTATDDGCLVGTSEARLFSLSSSGPSPVASFDAIDGRDDWFTPWGAPPDTRSLARTAAGDLLVNVHVGGLWRSGDAGGSWSPVVEVGADVHQVVADATSGTVVAAAAIGFGQSDDGGATWSWTAAGLHSSYCRAAAVAGDTVLVTASTGPRTAEGAIFRRPRIGDQPFERCRNGLPEAFPFNINTFQLAARGDTVAAGTDDGRLFVSDDAGRSWTLIAGDLDGVTCLEVL